jgi:hypothetical protein
MNNRDREVVRVTFVFCIICCFAPPTLGADNFGAEFGLPDGPLRVRNLSPAMQIYGIPRAVGAEVVQGYTESTYSLEISNNFQSEYREGTFAFFDGETYINSYRVRGGLRPGWDWGFEIPYVAHTNGNLDAIVDEFHELFGLPDGQRSIAPRNRLDYYIRSDGFVYADFSESKSGIGDVSGSLGYQVFDEDGEALAFRTQLKLPTGEAKRLTGSEAVDLSVWGEYEQALELSRMSLLLTLAGGVSYLGEGEIIPQSQEHWVGFGHLGLQIPLTQRIALHAQLDAHTTVIDTANALVGQGGVLGTLGGRFGVTERYWLDFSLIEDLANESASDVVVQILLGTRF